MVLPICEPSVDEYEEYLERVQPVGAGEKVIYSKAKNDPVYFMVNQLGIKPYFWQVQFLDSLNRGEKTMCCTSRQVGKTLAIAVFCLWACTYNTLPLEMTKKTKVLIISATEIQAMKIIGDIRDLMYRGDEHIHRISSRKKKGKDGEEVYVGGVPKFFTDKVATGKAAANSKSVITFTNRCTIVSLPPTGKPRGETASITFLDESAFIEDDDFLDNIARPTVSKTGDRIAMTSTPNGRQGFFFFLFDPDDERKKHEFKRIWVPYTAIKLDDPERVESLRMLEETSLLNGKERQFQQEYMASFNSSTNSFFDSEDIDNSVFDELSIEAGYSFGECDLAVDFGGTVSSRTVITISALEGVGSDANIRLLYQYEYPLNDDLTLIDDIEDLQERFNIQRVIFEMCPAAQTYSLIAEKKGWNLQMFNPAKDKAAKYFALKKWLRTGRVRMYGEKELIKQMKGLITEEGQRQTKIFHGHGLRDDMIDSFMMSTWFLTEEKRGIKVWDIDDF